MIILMKKKTSMLLKRKNQFNNLLIKNIELYKLEKDEEMFKTIKQLSNDLKIIDIILKNYKRNYYVLEGSKNVK